MALNSNFRTLTANNIEGIVDERNYLSSSFENGTLTGWTEMSVALTSGLPTGTPTISSTAASSLALSTTTSTPLSGSRSMLMTVASALTAGHGFISQEFTLDRMDLGKVLTVSFDYERISGTYNFSGTLGSQTLMVYIYDATAGGANWIQPAGFLGMNQSSNPGRVACTFQSSVTAGQKYRVAVIASQAASGASSIEFDNFTCSRQTAPIGPVVTDYTSFTGSWLASVTNPSIGNGTIRAWVARVGDSARIRYQIVPGSTTTFGSGDYYVMLPSGLTIDTNKCGPLTNGTQVFGSSYVLRAGVTRYFGVAAPYFTFNDRVSVKFQETVSGVNPVRVSSNSAWTPTIPATLQNGDEIDIEFEVPISGWSSNVQLSNDTDTRVVAMRVSQASQQNLSNITETKITNLSSLIVDTHAAWSSANNEYVIPVSGVYEIIGGIAYTANATGTRVSYISIVKGGVTNAYAAASRIGTNTAADQTIAQMSYIDSFSAGDKVYLTGYQSSGGVLATGTSLVSTFLQVKRLSGPSVVAASESVSAIYQTSAGQSIPHNSATVVVFGTKIFDSHSAMNASTGVFTCPVSGEYQLSAAFYFSTAITATATDIQTIAYKNGVAYLGVNNTKSGTAAAPLTTSGTIRIRCNAGDTLSCAVLQSNSATTAQTLLANAAFNWVAISRVGN